jgi:MFS family permease
MLFGAVMGTATALFTPAATGLTPLLLPSEHLQQANGLQQTANATALVFGPAMAGVQAWSSRPGQAGR